MRAVFDSSNSRLSHRLSHNKQMGVSNNYDTMRTYQRKSGMCCNEGRQRRSRCSRLGYRCLRPANHTCRTNRHALFPCESVSM